MIHDAPSDQLKQTGGKFDRIIARLDRIEANMATVRDVWVAVFFSTIICIATAGLILWVAI